MQKVHLLFFNYVLGALATAVMLCACSKPEAVPNRFSDTTMVKIADFQDKRLTDSLYALGEELNAKAEVYRLLAFGSIQDTTAKEYLEGALHLSEHELGVAAAFSLSQLGDGTHPFFSDSLTSSFGHYEYLGKFLIARGKHFDDNDSFDGIPWAYYRYALTSRVGVREALIVNRFLSDSSQYARLGAAHFFARSNALDTVSVEGRRVIVKNLMRAAQTDSAEIRMAAAFALRKVVADSVFAFLSNRFIREEDYRVRVNIIRALQKYPFKKAKEKLKQGLGDGNVNVGVAASEVILSNITKEQWIEFSAIARKTSDWRIQANLYEAALKVSDHKELSEEVTKRAEEAKNPYQKAAYITALRQSVMAFGFIHDALVKADTPIVRSAAAAALVEINYRENFDPSLNDRFAKIYVDAMQSGDAAVISTVAGALADSTLGYKEWITDISFLHEARAKLQSPRDAETIQSLDAAIAYFEKKELPVGEKPFNHPIDWKLVKRIAHNQQVVVQTSRGNITLQLYVEETPGTVANFVKLVQDGYFNNKFFHRVVPNFVAQAGCPRGDGWGGENYTIRSEFTPRRFVTGSVGMASSGKDTEGTQWFITHSPTPHLEGRYTNFGEVVEGIEIVHKLEVGDKIIDVRLK